MSPIHLRQKSNVPGRRAARAAQRSIALPRQSNEMVRDGPELYPSLIGVFRKPCAARGCKSIRCETMSPYPAARPSARRSMICDTELPGDEACVGLAA